MGRAVRWRAARGRARDPDLIRLSVASGLLVVPQFTAAALMVELLHDHRGVAVGVAAALFAAAQVAGGAGRLVVGVWSDRAATRVRPLKVLSVLIALGFALCAALDRAPVWALASVLVPTAALALCWNGLAITAAGELAPPGRTGIALGMQNTANYLSATVTPPLAGWVAVTVGWPAALLLAATAAVAARVLLTVPFAPRQLAPELP